MALLLDRRAPVDAVEDRFKGGPLTPGLHGWSDPPYGTPTARRDDVIALRVCAGAVVNPNRIDDHAADSPFGRRLRADPRLRAALTGERS